nr:MAG TPA: hypothetical protein [Bacteriophage sp.]
MEEKIERPIMTEDEFKGYIKAGSLRLFDAVRKFKSVKRAIRRGHVSPIGEVLPRRPYNNRKSTEGRYLNEVKRGIYARLK